jgi:hypothetical protein
MKYTPTQHLNMADLLEKKAGAERDPKKAKKQSEMANVFRTLASKAAAKKAKPAKSEPAFADDVTYQRALPFFKAGAAHFADGINDITEMVRGLVEHLKKAGMSPEAMRDMKPYVVRFVEDVRSGRESLDGIPLPAHGDDAGSEPEDVPPAAGQRGTGSVPPAGMEYSVPKDLPDIMMDGPSPFDTVESLERSLAELQAMPDFKSKKEEVERVKRFIVLRKRLEAERKTKAQAGAAIE